MGLLSATQNRDALIALQRAVEDRLSDQEQKRRIGERLRALRERSPYTQEFLADHIGVTLRAYQKQEQTGGIRFDNLEKLAALYGVNVSFFYDNGHDGEHQLDRVEQKLNAILNLLVTEQPGVPAEERMLALLQAEAALRSGTPAAEDPPSSGAAAG